MYRYIQLIGREVHFLMKKVILYQTFNPKKHEFKVKAWVWTQTQTKNQKKTSTKPKHKKFWVLKYFISEERAL